MNVISALKKDTMSTCRHQESSESRCREDQKLKSETPTDRHEHKYCFNIAADWKGNSASEAQRGEQEQDANDGTEGD